MRKREPVFEKSRSVQDMQHMRLMALLNELVRDKGVMKATQLLGVDYKTLTASMERGRLSRRMRGALEKALLEGEGSPAVEQRERNDALEGRLTDVEGRVEAVEKDVSKGFAAVRGDVKALGDEQAQMGRRLSQLESGRGAGEAGDAQDANAAPRGGTRLRREFPDLVTLDPAEDDEAVFGEAWPLIVEWRGLKETHPNKGKGVEWLRTKERLLSLELTLLEGQGMTLPPETYPLRGFERGAQTRWRHSALSDTRRALAKRELLRKVGRLCTFGLGWR